MRTVYSKPLLLAGVTFLKNPTSNEIAMWKFNTLWEEWF
jgi:hypothetical protein